MPREGGGEGTPISQRGRGREDGPWSFRPLDCTPKNGYDGPVTVLCYALLCVVFTTMKYNVKKSSSMFHFFLPWEALGRYGVSPKGFRCRSYLKAWTRQHFKCFSSSGKEFLA